MALKLQLVFEHRINQAGSSREQSAHCASRRLDESVAEAIASIRYGAVEITIHDGRIVQIEKREKLRPAEALDSSRGANAR